MKIKYFLPIVLLLLAYTTSKACDACGCAFSTAIVPTDRMTYFGVAYRNAYFKGWHQEVVGDALFVKEAFNRIDLNLKFTFKSRWELIANLPYNQVWVSRTDNTTEQYQGIGDASLLGRYALINHFGKKIDIRLALGAGIEAPTGNYQIKNSANQIPHVYQPGSGSTNYMLLMSGGVRNKNYGINFNTFYKHNGTNDLKYHRGNTTALNIDIFKDMYVGNVRVMPKITSNAEFNGRNRLDGFPYVNNTARNFIFSGIGTDIYYKKIFFNISAQKTVYQKITHGQLAAKYRLQTSINYIF